MDLLNKTIHPYFGTKEFQIGKNMSSLIDILHDTSNDEKEISLFGFQINISFFGSIRVSINIASGIIFRTVYFGKYKGKTIHGIGIGSKVKDLFKTGFTICTDDDAILMGEKCEAPFKYIFYINNEGLFIQNINDVLEHEITAIVTELPLYDLELTDSV